MSELQILLLLCFVLAIVIGVLNSIPEGGRERRSGFHETVGDGGGGAGGTTTGGAGGAGGASSHWQKPVTTYTFTVVGAGGGLTLTGDTPTITTDSGSKTPEERGEAPHG